MTASPEVPRRAVRVNWPRRLVLQSLAALSVATAVVRSPAATARNKIALSQIRERFRTGQTVTIDPGEVFLVGGSPIQIEGTSAAIVGHGMDTSILDCSEVGKLTEIFSLGAGGSLEVSDLNIISAPTIVHIPSKEADRADDPQAAQAAPLARRLALSNVRFANVNAVVRLTNDGFGRKAVGGIEDVIIKNCIIEDAERGMMIGDLGSMQVRRASVSDVTITGARRFGLEIGPSRRAGTELSEHITVENLISRDLVYEKDTNCGHLVLLGRNVTARNIDISGAVAEPAVLKQSNKESFYLQARDVLLEDVRIADSLADQAALVLKGEPIGTDSPKPEGGNYVVRRLRITQTEAALAPMRGVWVQVGPTLIENAQFDGLGNGAIIVNANLIEDIVLRDLAVSRAGGSIAIGLQARSMQRITIENLRVHDVASNEPSFTALRLSPKGSKGARLSDVHILGSQFLLGSAGDANPHTVGIALRANKGNALEDINITDCRFEGTTGIEISSDGGPINLRIEDCDFSGISDPARAVVLRPLGGIDGKAALAAAKVSFGGSNAGMSVTLAGGH